MLLLLACSGPPADTGGTPNPDGTNTAPTAEVLLAPDVLTAATDIVAAASATDPDGDPLVWDFVWTVNGQVVQEGLQNWLPAGTAVRGDTVNVEAIAWDGIDVSDPASAEGTVSNAPPVIIGVRIDPEQPLAGDTLRCEADGEDADGDPLTWTTVFRVDGQNYPDAPVPEDVTQSGETWFCQAIANDGNADSWPMDTYVVIE